MYGSRATHGQKNGSYRIFGKALQPYNTFLLFPCIPSPLSPRIASVRICNRLQRGPLHAAPSIVTLPFHVMPLAFQEAASNCGHPVPMPGLEPPRGCWPEIW